MSNRIDCPTCERMGRVTVIMPNSTLSTATCGDCNGEGMRYECSDPACRYCVHAASKQIPARPLFAWENVDIYS